MRTLSQIGIAPEMIAWQLRGHSEVVMGSSCTTAHAQLAGCVCHCSGEAKGSDSLKHVVIHMQFGIGLRTCALLNAELVR